MADDIDKSWNVAADGRIRAWLSINNPYRASDEIGLAVKERADAYGVGIHGHVLIKKEDALRADFYSPIRRYRDLGILCPSLYLIHMIHVVPEDIKLLAENQVKVVHCPGRSMHGAGGMIAHGTIPEMIDAGIVMGLGSDACAISRFIDMVRQMYLAAAAHKDVRLDANVIGCYKAFEMATVDGARAMMWDDEIGSLQAGKKADLIILDTSAPEMHPNPHQNPIANLVYSGSGAATKTVVIDGAIIMQDKVIKTIDVPALLKEVGIAAPKVLSRVNAKAQSKWQVC
jgi:cytosine/adenosine deaminase-related metal-dependent hydrolase